MREEAQAPVIAFDVNTGVYTAKVGREFTIAPTYEYVDRAVYAWKLEKTGRIIPTEPVLTYVIDEVEGEEKEDYYIELEVTTPQGDDARTDARGGLPNPAARDRPLRRGGGRSGGMSTRSRRTCGGARRRPTAGRCVVRGLPRRRRSGASRLTSSANRRWANTNPPAAENEDGADEKSIRVEVTEALPVSVTVPPIGRLYDGLTRTVPLGRSITLRPSIWNGRNPRYSWTVDGEEILDGTRLHLYAVRQRSEEAAFHGDGQLGRTCGGGGERGEVDRRGASDGGVQRRVLRRRGGFPTSGHAVQRSVVDEGLRIYACARPIHQ